MKPATCLAALALVSACAAPEPPLPDISPRAMAALPRGTDLRTVKRRDDGCYYIVIDDGFSGVIRKVRDRNGQLVCDEI